MEFFWAFRERFQKNVGQGYEFTAEIYTEEGDALFTKTLDKAMGDVPESYEEFVSSVIEGRQPSATAEHGIKVQKIPDGLYRSAAEGVEIRF